MRYLLNFSLSTPYLFDFEQNILPKVDIFKYIINILFIQSNILYANNSLFYESRVILFEIDCR